MSAVKRESSDITVSASTVVLDIEGTTTSISFVKDVLFPYVRKHVEEYAKKNLESEDFKKIVDAFRSQAKEDEENKVEGAVAVPDSSESATLTKALVDNVLWQMDNDRKTKCLKDLQGLIYEEGYKNGDLKGHVYEDVEPCLKSWTEQDKSVYIYSSGSVFAQKLLFGHTEKGDLLPHIKGHFDTTVGLKGESKSYKKILEQISCNASEVVFLTDVPKEAKAAKEAGINALLVRRDGNAPLTEEESSEFQVISSFEEIKFEQNIKKRKLSAENDVNTETENKEVTSCSESVNNEKPEAPKSNDVEEKMEVEDNVEPAKTADKEEVVESTSAEEKKVESDKVAEKSETVKSDSAEVTEESKTTQDKEVEKPEIKEEEKKEVADSTTNGSEVLEKEKPESADKEAEVAESAKPQETVESSIAESKTEEDKEVSVLETEAKESVTELKPVSDKTEETVATSTSENKTEKEETPKVQKAEAQESKEGGEGKAEVPKEETVEKPESADKTEKPAETEEKQSEEKVSENGDTKTEERAVNGESKTNGTAHDEKTPNGKMSNGNSSPAKTNGAGDDAKIPEDSTTTTKTVKSAESIPVEPVIEA